MPRFAVNCSTLFGEAPLLERFGRARSAGFDAVECWWPSEVDPEDFAAAVESSGVRLVLLGLDAGDAAAGERGYLNRPGQAVEGRIRERFDIALGLAVRLRCPLLHALVGNVREQERRENQLGLVRKRLRWMARLAAESGVTLVVEAMNPIDGPPYLFTRTEDVLRTLDAVGEKNVKYLYDVYHAQRGEGNLIETLRSNVHTMGHVQVADVPGRHQPGTGEINYARVLRTLDELSFDGYVGLEYWPLGPTEPTFDWLPPDRRGLVPAGELRL